MMLEVLDCLSTDHDHRFVLVAAGVCLLSTIVALRLYGRVLTASGSAQWSWLALAGFATGSGVWATHFIAMLAYEPGLRTGYSVAGTALSFLLSALTATAGFSLASIDGGRRLALRCGAGAVIGAGVGLMHYTGMSAFRTQGLVEWSPSYVVASVVVGVILAAAAMAVAGDTKRLQRIASAALLMTLAISGLHFTGMAAVSIVPDPTVAVPPSALSHLAMVILVSVLTLVIIAAAAAIVWVDAANRRASLSTLRAAIDALPEGMAYFDVLGRCVVWNKRYAELAPDGDNLQSGFTLEELLRKGLSQGRYPAAEGREEEWLRDRLALNAEPQGPIEHRLADGSWLRVEERRTPDGGTATVCVDVTELKRREASFRLMFEKNPAPMWVMESGTFRFLDVNSAAERQYGWSRDEFLSRSLYDVLAPEELPELEAIIAEGPRDNYAGERVWLHRRADGSDLYVRPYGEVLPWAEGFAILTALFDVTEQVSLESELRETADAMARASMQADAANRAKSEFLANMSHEIRTPLNGVVGMAEMLGRSELDAKDREMVEIIRSSSLTLERLLSDILDIARVEAGQVHLEAAPLHAGEVVRAVAALSKLKADEKGIGLHLDVSPDAEAWFVGDAVRLKQILTNLVSNAVKFTDAGEVRIAASLSENGRLKLAVTDTGVGFDVAHKEKIFGRFQQADGSITRQYGGTGLGLSISRQLAELMGGALDCASTPGGGSTFWAELPLERTAAPAAASAPRAPEGHQRGLRVLLADDHPTNRKVVELILAQTDVELVSVENGKEAVDAYAAGGFDIVLMDMQMPVMDGLTAVRLIRDHDRHAGRRTPVLMLTANALPEHVQAGTAAGADGHVAKPVSASGLLAAISEVLDLEAREAA